MFLRVMYVFTSLPLNLLRTTIYKFYYNKYFNTDPKCDPCVTPALANKGFRISDLSGPKYDPCLTSDFANNGFYFHKLLNISIIIFNRKQNSCLVGYQFHFLVSVRLTPEHLA